MFNLVIQLCEEHFCIRKCFYFALTKHGALLLMHIAQAIFIHQESMVFMLCGLVLTI